MTQPFTVPPDGGRATWTDGLHLFKALAEDTGGALATWLQPLAANLQLNLKAGPTPTAHSAR
jgi:hypothetical protein